MLGAAHTDISYLTLRRVQIMTNLLLNEGAIVTVRNVQLPLAKFVKFQPHTIDFLDLSNPKAVYVHATKAPCTTHAQRPRTRPALVQA